MTKIFAYCIKSNQGQIFMSTIRIKKKDCIADFVAADQKKHLWRYYSRIGWSCIKIKITIEK